MNVSLTLVLEEYVRRKVATGLYNNASEVVREALRLMVERETGGLPAPKKSEVVATLKALEPELRQRGIASAAVFGSVVRGQARPDSDVDVLVDVDPAAQFDLLDLVGVKNSARGPARANGRCRRARGSQTEDPRQCPGRGRDGVLMPPQRDPRLQADDILQAIANIEADTAGLDFERFVADRRVRQLVERNLEIISEASRRIPDRLKATEPEVPWQEIAGIGNVLRHDYGAVRPDILWGVRTHRLTALKAAVQRIRARLGG